MKHFKKAAAFILAAAMLVCSMAGCKGNESTSSSSSTAAGSQSANTGKKIKLSVFLGGGETIDQINAVVKKFNSQNDHIEIQNIPKPTGQTGYQMLSVMYNAKNAPTLIYLESNDILKLTDKLQDLSDMKEVKNANPGVLDDVKVNGKLYGLPTNIQGYGLMYSRAVLDKTMGKDFDPKTIKTRDDLKKVFDKIQAKGVAPVVITSLDWSLANHYLNQVYAGQAKDAAGRDAFIDKLYKGNANLAGNAVYNDYLDTFDLMKKYNYYKDNPLEAASSNTIDTESQIITSGDAAFWFMGNWAAPSIRNLDTSGDYGYIPVPLGDEKSPNAGKICTLVPGYYCIDTSQSTKEQQAAAREVIDYLLASADGHDYTVNQCKFIPAYSDNKLEIKEPLAKSVSEYAVAGKTFPMYSKYPSDHMNAVGKLMQGYLSGQTNRQTLAKQVEDYWKQQKK